MSLNVELLEQVKAHILAEPRRINMDDWQTELDEVDKHLRPACGTIACIAGWACVLGIGTRVRGNDIEWAAEEVLGLDDGGPLFFVDDWPSEFEVALRRETKGTLGYAEVVAARIDYFIKVESRYADEG